MIGFHLLLVGAVETGAVLEDIGFAINRQNDAAFGAMRFMLRSGFAPDKFSRSANAIVIGERT